MRPKDVANPVVQRSYQAIVHKALRPSEGLPLPDWRGLKPLRPDAALFGAAKTALDAFALACPTAAQEREEKKRAWGKRGDAASAAAAGGAGGAGGGEPPAKQMRPTEHSSTEAAAGATLALKASRVEAIDSGRHAKGCNPMRPRLQPRASEAATPCVRGCNPVRRRLQPRAHAHVSQAGRSLLGDGARRGERPTRRGLCADGGGKRHTPPPPPLGLGVGAAARDGSRWQPWAPRLQPWAPRLQPWAPRLQPYMHMHLHLHMRTRTRTRTRYAHVHAHAHDM